MSEDKAPRLTGAKREFAEAYIDNMLEESVAAESVDISISDAKKLLKDTAVMKYIKYQLRTFRLSPEEYIRRLEMIAFGDIMDLYVEDESDDGHVANKLRRVQDIPISMRRRIKKMKATHTQFGILFNVELVSREKAIELLGKILAVQGEGIDQTENTGVIAVPIILDDDDWEKIALKHQTALQTPGTNQ